MKSTSASPERGSEVGAVSETGTPGEWDLGELAAKFAEHGGGRVSPEISAELALQIVLNEIVEQACLATGASGAAIVLERGGEWVCRASTGRSAPQLGARLDTASGLSGACVATRTVQRCDDTENDPRADVEACRILGIRSAMILPVLRNGELAGVFEAFSTLPSGFGERDERTLEALSRRVLNNLERASGSMPGGTTSAGTAPVATMSAETTSTGAMSAETISAAESSKSTQAVADSAAVSNAASSERSDRGSDAEWNPPDQPSPRLPLEAASRRNVNFITLALGVAVLAYAVLMTVLVAHRFGWRRAGARGHVPAAVSTTVAAGAERQTAGAGRTAGLAASGSQSAGATASRIGSASVVPAASASHATDTFPPPGGLLVFENGKEIFRMKPSVEQGQVTDAGRTSPAGVTTAHESGVQRASIVEPAGVLELPPDVAEASLLHRVEPDYPEEARQQRIQGAVVLSVRIAQDGGVQSATLVSGPPLLAQAASDAVKQWRFKPRSVGGRPAEMHTSITLNFRLPER
ncbi:MAG: TonB family protein [Candidatus Sulfotelmatobacter sp.]